MRAVSLTAGLLSRLQRARPPQGVLADVSSARNWLETLPLQDPGQVNALFTRELTALGLERVGSVDLLEVLEVLRPTIHVAQAEYARQYRGHPAPLRKVQADVVEAIIALWDRFAGLYLHCATTWKGPDRQGARGRATALHRALDATSRLVAEYYFAYRMPPPEVYARLNAMFRLGEAHGLLKTPVTEPFQKRGEARVRDAWVRALLLDGCLPREHHHRELGIIFRLLEQWSPKVRVTDPDEGEPDATPPLFINLDEPCGLRPSAGSGERIRSLRTGALATAIRQLITGLRQGAELTDLGFSAELSRREFEAMLLSLYRQWCEGGIRRMNERQPSEARAHVSAGLRAAHFYLGRKPFEQPFGPGSLPERGSSSRAHHSEERVRAATSYLQAHGISAEEWLVRDESISGLGLTRPHDEPAEPWLELGLLISVRPRGLNTTLVGTIRWMQESASQDMNVGVRLLPGVPTAIAARIPGSPEFEPAILMLPLPVASAPSSLVIAPGRLAPHQVVEIWREGIDRIEITALLESGGEFERFAFMPAGSVYDPGSELDSAI
jgi:hypothetical protein